MKRPDGPSLFLWASVLAVCVSVGFVALTQNRGRAQPAGQSRIRGPLTVESIPFNGRRAYGYLRQICELGPRPSGSEAMAKQQAMLQKHFRALGGDVEMQEFRIRDRRNGQEVPMANLIARWHPNRKQRILLCAHYDTRPFPDRDPDPNKRKGDFLGANDGASGVAVLAELAHELSELTSPFGVDVVLFDGEEYVFDDQQDEYFLGSKLFAENYKSAERDWSYRWGILLDMVGDADLRIYQERHSVQWRDTRPLVGSLWRTARRLGVREFVPRAKYEVLDDHVPLHDVGGIPCCDIIDFEYPRPGTNYWHTTQDTPEHCSALSLAKVGWVVHEWLKEVKSN